MRCIYQKNSASFWVVELRVSFIFVFIFFYILLIIYSFLMLRNFLFKIDNPRTFTLTYCKIFFLCIFLSNIWKAWTLGLISFIMDKFHRDTYVRQRETGKYVELR